MNRLKRIKNYILDMDKFSLVLTIILFLFGLFAITSASSREAIDNLAKNNVYYYLLRQGFILLISATIYIIILNIPTKTYKLTKKIWYSLLVILSIICFLMIFRATTNRGANNWINIPGIPFKVQPSEFLKFIGIIAMSIYLERYAKVFRNIKIDRRKYIGGFLLLGLLPTISIFLQGDTGTAGIYFFIFIILFLASTIPLKEKVAIGFCGLACILVVFSFLVLIGHNPISKEKQQRLTNYWAPCNINKRNNDGYQICNAYIAMNLGGVKGVGVGKSTQKYSYIPEPHTDMIFSIITEENGFIIGAIIIITYMILISRTLFLSSKATNLFGKYSSLAVGTLIFIHVAVNLGGLLAILPLTGVPLPFMSYGGSFTITLTMSLALVQRINVENRRYKLKF